MCVFRGELAKNGVVETKLFINDVIFTWFLISKQLVIRMMAHKITGILENIF